MIKFFNSSKNSMRDYILDYSPYQPREPKGTPEGGQFADKKGSGSSETPSLPLADWANSKLGYKEYDDALDVHINKALMETDDPKMKDLRSRIQEIADEKYGGDVSKLNFDDR